MADAEYRASLFACFQDPFRAGRPEREWLLAKNLLAGFERSDSHFFVQKVRGHDCNRFEVGASDQVPVVVYEVQPVRDGKGRGYLGIDVAPGNDLEARALGEAGHNLLAPPAEADNSDADHRSPAFPFLLAENAGQTNLMQWSCPRTASAPFEEHVRYG
jgi:hypothetical protein